MKVDCTPEECFNIPGSYFCACNPGFAPHGRYGECEGQ